MLKFVKVRVFFNINVIGFTTKYCASSHFKRNVGKLFVKYNNILIIYINIYQRICCVVTCSRSVVVCALAAATALLSYFCWFSGNLFDVNKINMTLGCNITSNFILYNRLRKIFFGRDKMKQYENCIW